MTELLVGACKLEKRTGRSAEDLNLIGGELETLCEAAGKFCSSVETGMLTDFENLLTQAKDLAAKVNAETEAEVARLDAFDAKVEDIKISDVDQFFMSKEIDRHKATLCGVQA